jgi:hypothetical protein
MTESVLSYKRNAMSQEIVRNVNACMRWNQKRKLYHQSKGTTLIARKVPSSGSPYPDRGPSTPPAPSRTRKVPRSKPGGQSGAAGGAGGSANNFLTKAPDWCIVPMGKNHSSMG